ncbi:helix-turn-helix domain-containing protein [Flavobacterium sp. GSP11]|uniref:helix-turn-helix domain-containing protein n=1 Tax=Flavobacterium sp. GSP11 TaxID=3401730 RepID=UPI003AAF5A40
MATGNLTYRMQRDIHSNQLDELVVMLNTTAEKMELLVSQLGYINPHYTYQSLVQTTIILDKNSTIKSFSTEVPALLGYTPDKLLKLSFNEILAKQSMPLWKIIKAEALADAKANATVQFFFTTASRHLIPSFCTVSRLMYSNKILVTSITTILEDMVNLNNEYSPIKTKNESETLTIQKLHAYILSHLDEPLPSLKELAAMFASEEHKLKIGFRKYFNTSVYKYYHRERLKKSHLLIQQTSILLKEIAFMCGFTAYLNFYKAFKKHFGYAPSDLSRPSE